jgi:hypothetical protein
VRPFAKVVARQIAQANEWILAGDDSVLNTMNAENKPEMTNEVVN